MKRQQMPQKDQSNGNQWRECHASRYHKMKILQTPIHPMECGGVEADRAPLITRKAWLGLHLASTEADQKSHTGPKNTGKDMRKQLIWMSCCFLKRHVSGKRTSQCKFQLIYQLIYNAFQNHCQKGQYTSNSQPHRSHQHFSHNTWKGRPQHCGTY